MTRSARAARVIIIKIMIIISLTRRSALAHSRQLNGWRRSERQLVRVVRFHDEKCARRPTSSEEAAKAEADERPTFQRRYWKDSAAVGRLSGSARNAPRKGNVQIIHLRRRSRALSRPQQAVSGARTERPRPRPREPETGRHLNNGPQRRH